MSTEQSRPTGETLAPATRRRPWLGWLVFALSAMVVLLLALLLASVAERRGEARIEMPQSPLAPLEVDSARWAVNWPRQYDTYRQTFDDTTRTEFGGAQPRDYLEAWPANVILFAGYSFSMEYRQARGHARAIEDVTGTKRLNEKTPATCWSCKSPDVLRQMAEYGAAGLKLGDPTPALAEHPLAELTLAGAARFYDQPFAALKDRITHPIGCLDCHEPETMRLRVSRPALIEAFRRQGRDVETVSHQEMRTLVCAQCHVEYYFQKEGNYLAFPWDKGTNVDSIAEYYEEKQFTDWTHAVSRTPMVKMQHPDYEVYSTGIHAYRNVACADCHMPYRTEGGAKFTDHHVQSPLLNVANSCAVCHRWSEKEIADRVVGIQNKVLETRRRAEQAIAHAHFDVAACLEAGAADAELLEVRSQLRQAQLRWDFVATNNGLGFHSPAECLRILSASVDIAQECRVASARILAVHGYAAPVRYPDFSTKEKAQALATAYAEGKGPKLLDAGR